MRQPSSWNGEGDWMNYRNEQLVQQLAIQYMMPESYVRQMLAIERGENIDDVIEVAPKETCVKETSTEASGQTEPYQGWTGQFYLCKCGCHTNPGTIHFVPCCTPCPVCEVFVAHSGLDDHISAQHADRVRRVKPEVAKKTAIFLSGLTLEERRHYEYDRVFRQNLKDLLYQLGFDRVRAELRPKAEAAVVAYLDALSDDEPWNRNEPYFSLMVDDAVDQLVLKRFGGIAPCPDLPAPKRDSVYPTPGGRTS